MFGKLHLIIAYKRVDGVGLLSGMMKLPGLYPNYKAIMQQAKGVSTWKFSAT